MILASESPRRRLLLPLVAQIQACVSPSIDETPLATETAQELAARLAATKARAASTIELVAPPAVPVVSADTVVALGKTALGKPTTPDEAREMIQALSGRSHTVITAVALTSPNTEGTRVVWASTEVRMRDLGRAEIEASVERGDPFDKAGGYAIQDPELRPVQALHGCFPNVVGLPLCAVEALLQDPLTGGAISRASPCRLCREAATLLRRGGFWAPEML